MFRNLFKPSEDGLVIFPFVVMRRLDCVLEPQKDEARRLCVKAWFGGEHLKYASTHLVFNRKTAENSDIRDMIFSYLYGNIRPRP